MADIKEINPVGPIWPRRPVSNKEVDQSRRRHEPPYPPKRQPREDDDKDGSDKIDEYA